MMKFKSPLLAVSDIAASIDFYKRVLGLRVVMDFGANVTLTGGVCLQTLDTWQDFLEGNSISLGGNAGELYFEEDDFDAFARKLQGESVEYVHPVKEHRWGQRVVRLYDPDHHIIEVGENIKSVCRRFLGSGMTEEQTAARMDVPLKFVKACQK
jgi:catechol 2,3-dioxygenase-like lactoylglutathione lyase family enzyme